MNDQLPSPAPSHTHFQLRRRRAKYTLIAALVALVVICLACILVYNLPPVHSRLAWRLEAVWEKIKPQPTEQIFIPQEQAKSLATLQAGTLASPLEFTSTPSHVATKAAGISTPTPTVGQGLLTPTAFPQSTATPNLQSTIINPQSTPTPSASPAPPMVMITGVVYEDQHNAYNYCAPANLAMALSFWGWHGNRNTVGPVIKPDSKDKNVMPYEMVDYVLGYTDLKAIERVGGDIDLIKRLLSAGFPVLVEKGTFLTDLQNKLSWMGHYEVITGYDDARQVFIGQDSYLGPNTAVPYDTMIVDWRSFNYTYILIYSADKEAQVLELLGPDADETENYRRAAQKASDEIFTLSGAERFFALFNRGTNLVSLQDYAGAAAIYDEAFTFYPNIAEKDRPWRILWYQTGPYKAYFYTGRYYDVISRADITLNEMKSEKNLEESYYWRAMAKAALGDTDGAIQDLREALKWHPNWSTAINQLQSMGVNP
jgi:tetratricopeptide (TPR) repeat protein